MKPLILLSILLSSLLGYGQKNTYIKEWQPIFFLDSKKIQFDQVHFDPNKIASMNVESNYIDSTNKVHGKVSITSKDPNNFNFLTISDITKIYKKNDKTPTIFMLDDQFLKDLTSFKIDSSYILKVEITKAADIDYLKNTFPDFSILNIITRTKGNLENLNKIKIQGTE